jgi:hypothetical protein
MDCESHAGAVATRQCSRCRRGLCPLCVKELTIKGRVLEVCPRCRAPLVDPTWVPAPPLDPRQLLGRAFTGEALLSAAAIALCGALSFIPGFGSLFKLAFWGSAIGTYFQIIAWVGGGKPGFPGASDAFDDIPALLRMTLRGAVCAAVAAVPYLLWRLEGGQRPLAAVALFVAGMTYLPAVLVTVVLTGSTLGALYPVAWVRIVARAPRSYAWLLLLFAGAVVAAALLFAAANRLFGALPLVGDWLTYTLLVLLAFAQASLVGGFLHRHADELGYV